MRARAVDQLAGHREAGLFAAGELDAVAKVRPEQRRDLGKIVVQRTVEIALGGGGEAFDFAGRVGLQRVRLDLELLEAQAIGGGVVVGVAVKRKARFLPDGLVGAFGAAGFDPGRPGAGTPRLREDQVLACGRRFRR